MILVILIFAFLLFFLDLPVIFLEVLSYALVTPAPVLLAFLIMSFVVLSIWSENVLLPALRIPFTVFMTPSTSLFPTDLLMDFLIPLTYPVTVFCAFLAPSFIPFPAPNKAPRPMSIPASSTSPALDLTPLTSPSPA